MITSDPVYTVLEFCRHLKISRSHAYKLWREGRGPATIRLGRRRLVPAEAIKRWLVEEVR